MVDLFGNKEIRVLSWKEPFATLMLHGKIETRTWFTSYRGLVLICASKVTYTEAEIIRISGEVQTQRIFTTMNSKGIKEQCGYAIAVGELVDCRMMREVDEDKCFVVWNPDLYCHIYENVRAIKPLPWKGSLGWRKLDQGIINQIEYL